MVANFVLIGKTKCKLQYVESQPNLFVYDQNKTKILGIWSVISGIKVLIKTYTNMQFLQNSASTSRIHTNISLYYLL